jgi:hypothetical protein
VGLLWLALILAACTLQVQIQNGPSPLRPPQATPGVDAIAPASTASPEERAPRFRGDGAASSSYPVTLAAGRLVVHSSCATPGLLMIEISDSAERTVGAITHVNAQGEHRVEVVIPASGVYTVEVDYTGTGAWQVELEQPPTP